jgi:hypothetical protein
MRFMIVVKASKDSIEVRPLYELGDPGPGDAIERFRKIETQKK